MIRMVYNGYIEIISTRLTVNVVVLTCRENPLATDAKIINF